LEEKNQQPTDMVNFCINTSMVVGDKIRLIKDTTFHKVGDEGVIEEIDLYRLHAIAVRFPCCKGTSLFPIMGHCASLLNCRVDINYEIVKEET